MKERTMARPPKLPRQDDGTSFLESMRIQIDELENKKPFLTKGERVRLDDLWQWYHEEKLDRDHNE